MSSASPVPGDNPNPPNPFDVFGNAHHALEADVRGNKTRYGTMAQSQYFITGAQRLLGIQTQAEFARFTGASTSAVWRWVNGESRPTSKYLQRIGTLMLAHNDGVPIDEIAAVRWDEAPCTIVWVKDSRYAERLAAEYRRKYLAAEMGFIDVGSRDKPPPLPPIARDTGGQTAMPGWGCSEPCGECASVLDAVNALAFCCMCGVMLCSDECAAAHICESTDMTYGAKIESVFGGIR